MSKLTRPLRRFTNKHAKTIIAALCCGALLLTSGCAGIAYYQQAISGHMRLLSNSTPNTELIASSATDQRLVAQLEKVEALKEFAQNQLSLPAKNQYTHYVDTGDRYVVWNLFAAPAFSLEAKEWCYLVIGCAAYRGYYNKQDALQHAAKLTRKGWDVYVAGITAYSTLGWLRDPVLNTFIYRSDAQLADLLFHELAHQRLYINGDSQFNESFATLVAQVGVQRWYTAKNTPHQFDEYRSKQRKHQQFIELITEYRENLKKTYDNNYLSDDEKRIAKEQIFSNLQAAYQRLKVEWGGVSRYDWWFDQPLNNAQMNTISTYHKWVPALQILLEQHDGNLESFYTACSELKKLSSAERQAFLVALAQ